MHNRNEMHGEPPMARFLAKVVRVGECDVWQGAKSGRGYGRFFVDGHNVIVHRWIYQQRHGALEGGHLFVCHTCDNPACVRDEHHFVGTVKDNMADCARKGRNNPQPMIAAAAAAKIALNPQPPKVCEWCAATFVPQRATYKQTRFCTLSCSKFAFWRSRQDRIPACDQCGSFVRKGVPCVKCQPSEVERYG